LVTVIKEGNKLHVWNLLLGSSASRNLHLLSIKPNFRYRLMMILTIDDQAW